MSLKRKKIKILIISFLTIFLVQVPFSFAQIDKAFDSSGDSAYATFTDSSQVYKNTADIDEVIHSILNALFSLLGIIFLILIVYAGIKWMIARGNPEDVKKAKDTLMASIIGLLIVLAAYSLTWFIFNFFISTGETLDI